VEEKPEKQKILQILNYHNDNNGYAWKYEKPRIQQIT